MKPPVPTPIYLVPEQGIEIIEGQTVASTCPAWLHIEPIAELARLHWIRLRYSSSFFDEPVRPLIRFVSTKGDAITLPMNGPVLGTAEWIGRVPEATVRASISPVRRTGPFAFRLDGLTPVRRTALLWQGRHSPDWLFWAARSRLVNSRREAWQALSFAAGGTPMAAYAQWQARLARPIDLAGLDRPRTDWRVGPDFRLILKLGQDNPDRLRDTIRSLHAQVYPRWTLHGTADATTSVSLLSTFREEARTDPRLSESALNFGQSISNASGTGQIEFFARIDAGDSLPDYALAVVAEEIGREPGLDLIYSDEDCTTSEGDVRLPILKPDWSPLSHKNGEYPGRLTFLRDRSIAAKHIQRLLSDEDGVIGELAGNIPRIAVRHIRRILYRRQRPIDGNAFRPSEGANSTSDEPSRWPDVAVIIPSRDGAGLLADCIHGLREKTDYPSFETIVLDNGSTAPDAVRLLRRIAAEPHTSVLHRPGPYNYSALNNDGARTTKARVLLFLNNDIVMLEDGWLKAMVRLAIRPEAGVVGAKLLFANGRIQHAGVVLGFGGIAGHVYRRLPKHHRGYLAQLTAPREVSAVTAACIAIERSKFEAVGGFDAENLPVDLNDIDLCLRVAEHGWTNIWTPQATLIHLQSATRGIDSDPYALYRKERTYFVERWSHVIRDDPFYHPGLSLYAHDIALA